jgi:hypothetical protein
MQHQQINLTDADVFEQEIQLKIDDTSVSCSVAQEVRPAQHFFEASRSCLCVCAGKVTKSTGSVIAHSVSRLTASTLS